MISDFCTTEFVYSIWEDDSNEAAEGQGKIAQDAINKADGYSRYELAAFSHGGQSVYFMDNTHCNDIFILDATTTIRGYSKDTGVVSSIWSEKIINLAAEGTNIYVFASSCDYRISINCRATINKIDSYARKTANLYGTVIRKIGENEYEVTSIDGTVGYIYTYVLGGMHGDICIRSAPYIMEVLSNQ